ncbi:MAG: hypothetical protein WC417_07815 [Candidatus Omnitrophota bacterium]
MKISFVMAKTKLLLICLLSVLLSSGCFTGHKRPKDYVFPGKYRNKIIAENRFEVSFVANKSIDEQKAKALALLKCSIITLENGYKYFLVSEQIIERQFFTSRPTVILKITCFLSMPKMAEEDIYDAYQLKTYIEMRYKIKDPGSIRNRSIK